MRGESEGPDFATILDWTEGRLDEHTAAMVADAARDDPRVRDILAWLAEYRGVAAALPLTTPPPFVGQQLRRLYARRAAGSGPGDPPPVVATLLVDSRNDVGLVGVRGADDHDDLIRLAYTTGVADVVLDVQRRSDGQLSIDGQVLLFDPDTAATAFAVEATAPGVAPVRSVGGDRNGRFRLAPVSDRVSSLRLDSGEVAIVVPLDLHARP